MTKESESLFAFRRRAAALGEITEYEADGSGRVYAVYGNGEILPIGVTLPALASQSHITAVAFDVAVRAASSEPNGWAAG